MMTREHRPHADTMHSTGNVVHVSLAVEMSLYRLKTDMFYCITSNPMLVTLDMSHLDLDVKMVENKSPNYHVEKILSKVELWREGGGA